MASVNKVILIGNLGKDPEVRYMTSGAAVCNLRLATTRSWKSREAGDRQEETEWHSVVLYERLAEVASEYLKKGRSVYIEGRIKTRKWQDKEGKDNYTTEIIADRMELLGGRDGGTEEATSRYPRGQAGTTGDAEGFGRSAVSRVPVTTGDYAEGSGRPVVPPRVPVTRTPPVPKSPTTFGGDMDDDIPF